MSSPSHDTCERPDLPVYWTAAANHGPGAWARAKKVPWVRKRTDAAAVPGDHQPCLSPRLWGRDFAKELHMNRIVYIVGAVVIILFILGFLGLR
jgi:hypothetical protein